MVFSLLACPFPLIEQAGEVDSAMDLFKLVTEHRMALEIFRDYVSAPLISNPASFLFSLLSLPSFPRLTYPSFS